MQSCVCIHEYAVRQLHAGVPVQASAVSAHVQDMGAWNTAATIAPCGAFLHAGTWPVAGKCHFPPCEQYSTHADETHASCVCVCVCVCVYIYIYIHIHIYIYMYIPTRGTSKHEGMDEQGFVMSIS
jgi:hypothetical protein